MQTQHGFTLLEVIISLFILSLLLLGLDAMQLTALRQAQATYYFSVASEQLKGMAETLETLHGRDFHTRLAQWNESNKQLLPQGRGDVVMQDAFYTLTLSWGQVNTTHCQHNQIGQAGCVSMTAYL